MNFYQTYEYSSQQWIFIMTINLNHNDEFSSVWLILLQRWTFIKTMNYLDIAIIFHSVLLNCVPIFKIFSLNYNLSYGWAWLSSAPACWPIFVVFTYIFVYFYLSTDILTKKYWARYLGGLGKKLVHLKNIYLCFIWNPKLTQKISDL